MPKKSDLTLKIEKLMDTNPNLTTYDVVKATGFSDTRKIGKTIHNIHRSRKSVSKTKSVSKNCVGCHLTIQLPDKGIELKVSKNGVLFTLEIGEEGITYMPSNAKKKPTKQVPWAFLKLFQEAKFSIT